MAARDGFADLAVALLMRGGIDIDQADENGWTPLMYSAQAGCYHVAEILVQKGASVSVAADADATALHLAACHGHPKLAEMLVRAGAHIEAAESQGATPLHMSANEGKCEVMRVLLDAGANPDSRLHNRETPLLRAATKGHAAAIRELARANANPLLAATKMGETFLPLEVAAQFGHLDAVSELLDRFGIKGCGGDSGGAKSLRLAAHGNHVDIMAKLTGAGVVDAGYALVVAAQCGSIAPVKLLLQLGQKHGNTAGVASGEPVIAFPTEQALVCSASFCPPNSHKIARLLLDAGADISLVLPTGHTEGQFLRGAPLAITGSNLAWKTVGGKPATEEQLQRLGAIERLLLHREAIHATSWLWVSGDGGSAHATRASQHRAGKTKTSTPSTTARLPMNWRRHGAGALLPAVLRLVGGRAFSLSSVSVVV